MMCVLEVRGSRAIALDAASETPIRIKRSCQLTPLQSHARRPMASTHRPQPQPSLAGRNWPSTQAFTTSSLRRAKLDTSTIDYMVFPTSESLTPPEPDPTLTMRYPLLPDNFLTKHAPEHSDEPLAAPEIVVIAADPSNVMPSALTEVEGIGVDGVELKFAHAPDEKGEKEPGMLTDLWKGLIEDVFGENKAKPSA
jgi:hypothetical protein